MIPGIVTRCVIGAALMFTVLLSNWSSPAFAARVIHAVKLVAVLADQIKADSRTRIRTAGLFTREGSSLR